MLLPRAHPAGSRSGGDPLSRAPYDEPVKAAARLLLVEDDPDLSRLLAELLESEGYEVATAKDGRTAVRLGLAGSFDAMVLDRGLQGIEGLDVLGQLRAAGRYVPTLVLSALSTPRDRIHGLDAGAEDYLGKPFDVDELLARLTALLRRGGTVPTDGPLRVPGGSLDPEARTVRLDDGAQIGLSERESRLLETLTRASGLVVSRPDLLDAVFDTAEDEGVVETYVSYLRRKLGPDVVVTVRGFGYRIGGS